MSMNKHHFTDIARILDAKRDEFPGETHVIESIAYGLAEYFKEQNYKFNRDVFLENCGLGDYRMRGSR